MEPDINIQDIDSHQHTPDHSVGGVYGIWYMVGVGELKGFAKYVPEGVFLFIVIDLFDASFVFIFCYS